MLSSRLRSFSFSLPSADVQSPSSRSCTFRVGLDVIGTSYWQAQKIATNTVCGFQRAEVFLIIFVQLATQMQPNLVQHTREIHHAARHFFGTLWIGSHRQMNRIIPWRRNIDQTTGREPFGKSSRHPDALNEPKTAE